jgi:hypothetical protein
MSGGKFEQNTKKMSEKFEAKRGFLRIGSRGPQPEKIPLLRRILSE